MADPVTRLRSPTRIDYQHTASANLSAFLISVGKRQFIGSRCPSCAKVYVPPRGSCPCCAVAMSERVNLPDTGTVTMFCVVNVPFEGQVLKPPYACAHVLLDGADLAIFHLVGGCAVQDVRMGMRVRALWVPESEMTPSLDSIRWFEPTGEPDVVAE